MNYDPKHLIPLEDVIHHPCFNYHEWLVAWEKYSKDLSKARKRLCREL
jgi:hypothetical protein